MWPLGKADLPIKECLAAQKWRCKPPPQFGQECLGLPQPSMSCPIGTRPTIVRYCQDYNRVPISSGALGCLGRHRTQDEEPLRLYSEFSQQVRSQTQVALRVLWRQVSG